MEHPWRGLPAPGLRVQPAREKGCVWPVLCWASCFANSHGGTAAAPPLSTGLEGSNSPAASPCRAASMPLASLGQTPSKAKGGPGALYPALRLGLPRSSKSPFPPARPHTDNRTTHWSGLALGSQLLAALLLPLPVLLPLEKRGRCCLSDGQGPQEVPSPKASLQPLPSSSASSSPPSSWPAPPLPRARWRSSRLPKGVRSSEAPFLVPSRGTACRGGCARLPMPCLPQHL